MSFYSLTSYSQLRINQGALDGGTPTPPPFVNSQSILLDGVDDFVNIGTTSLGITTAISISAWVKIPTTNTGGGGSNFQEIICEDATSGTNRNWALNWRGGTRNNWQWVVWNTNGGATLVTSSGLTPNDNQWHHILATYDGTSNADGVKLYIDGGTPFTATALNTGIRSVSSVEATIGATSGGSALRLEGTLDEIAVWDSVINIGDVWDGSGVPFDISSTNPLSWWRCGDGDTAPTLTDNGSGGNNGTMTNFSTFSTDVPTIPFSTRSIALDGVDDYVNCGSASYLQNLSEFSVSLWAKQPTATSTEDFIGDWNYNSAGNFSLETGTVSGSATKLTFYIRKLGGTVGIITTQNYVFSENVWNHIVITFNSGTPNIYVNGIAQGLNVPSLPTSLAYGNGSINIGRLKGLGRYFTGNIDEVSLFNTELSASDVTSIYNGGVPNDISSLSPLSWWRCGDGDTSPTLTDNGSGGNDGTMTNFTTFSTDVPT